MLSTFVVRPADSILTSDCHLCYHAAAKCIKKDNLTKEDLEALAVEVKAMELLTDHPNFVKYYDFFSEKYV